MFSLLAENQARRYRRTVPLFTPETARKAHRQKSVVQCRNIQDALHSASELLKEDLRLASDTEDRARIALALANLARGWQAIHAQLRIIRGKPGPGSLRPVVAPKPEKSTKKGDKPTLNELIESAGESDPRRPVLPEEK